MGVGGRLVAADVQHLGIVRLGDHYVLSAVQVIEPTQKYQPPGTIIDGTESIAQAGERFFQLILQTASGKKSKSEEFGYGDDEFAPWTIGATM